MKQDHSSKELTQKQGELILEIRRSDRNEMIVRKRMLNSTSVQVTQELEEVEVGTDMDMEVEKQEQSKEKSEGQRSKGKGGRSKEKKEILEIGVKLQNAIVLVRSGEEKSVEEGIKEIRRLMCLQKNAPVQDVIDYGLVPLFIALAHQEKEPLRAESAWILLNMCNGTTEQARHLIEKGLLRVIEYLLNFSQITLIENAVWSFGNIVAEPTLISLVMSSGIIEKIIEVVGKIPSIELLKNAAWSFSNICRNKAPLTTQRVRSITAILLTAWGTTTDSETLYYEILWGISNVAHLEVAQELIMSETLVQKLLEIIAGSDESKKISVLRILSRLCNTQKNTETIFVEKLFFLMNNAVKSLDSRIRLEALHLVNNACSTSLMVTSSFSNSEIFISQLTKMSECENQKHLMNIISIFKSFATTLPFKTAVSVFAVHEIMRSFALFLQSKNIDIQMEALDVLMTIFQVCDPKESNPFVEMFNRNNGAHILEAMESNESNEIYEKSLAIIEGFYQIDVSLE